MQKKLFVFFTLFLISNLGWGQLNQNVSDLPNFASLAEKVTPAVVNVSVTKVIKSPVQNEMRRGPFNDPFFDDFPLVKQSRLSVMPVKLNQWKKLIKMSEKK